MSFFGRAFNLARGAVKVGISGDDARTNAAVEAELRREAEADAPRTSAKVRSERPPAAKMPQDSAPGPADAPPSPPELNPDGTRKRRL